jgi:hypothetical protein
MQLRLRAVAAGAAPCHAQRATAHAPLSARTAGAWRARQHATQSQPQPCTQPAGAGGVRRVSHVRSSAAGSHSNLQGMLTHSAPPSSLCQALVQVRQQRQEREVRQQPPRRCMRGHSANRCMAAGSTRVSNTARASALGCARPTARLPRPDERSCVCTPVPHLQSSQP